MKNKIISCIAAASVATASFVSLSITASAVQYNASDLTVGQILTAGTDTIKQNGGTTAWIYKSLLKLTYNAADGTQVNYTETQDGSTTTVYKDGNNRYQYWKVASVTKENHDYSRDDYIVTLTANDPYATAVGTTNVCTGEEFPLISVTEFTGEVQYSLDNESWSTDVPKASDVGSYTVYYKAVPGTQTNNVESAVGSVNSMILARDIQAGEIRASQVEEGRIFTGGVDSIYQDGGTSVIYNSLLKLTYKYADGTTISEAYSETKDGQSTTVYRSSDGRYVYWEVTEKSSTVIDYYGQFPRTDYMITLTARDPSLTAEPTGKTLEWTGEEQDLIDPVEAEHGTVYYSLDGEAWSEDIPTAAEIGIYQVYYKVVGDSYYNSIDPTSVVSIITPKQASAEYKHEGDFTGDEDPENDIASAWSVTVDSGSTAIESLDLKINDTDGGTHEKTEERAIETPTVTNGIIVLGVAVNHPKDDIAGFTVVLNGEDIEAVEAE